MSRRVKKDRGAVFLAELETWLGTPFVEHQSAKLCGCDCKGAMAGAASEIGFPEAASLYAITRDYNLRRKGGIPGATFREGMAALFDEVAFEDRRPGDLLLCDFDGQPGHLAAYAGDDEAIHTQIKSKAYLKRTALRALFFYYPLNSMWRWRAVA